MQGKKFISPGAWFSMNYPSDWNEFEDGEGSFLFYNPDVWTGNFRISAFKGNATYGRDAVRQELKENESASLVKVGALESAYSKVSGGRKILYFSPVDYRYRQYRFRMFVYCSQRRKCEGSRGGYRHSGDSQGG